MTESTTTHEPDDALSQLLASRFVPAHEIRGKSCTIQLVARPAYCDRGNWDAYIVEPGSLSLDYADRWPRYYFDLSRAKLEVEAFLIKRGEAVEPLTWREVQL